jgi:hypothetical protein
MATTCCELFVEATDGCFFEIVAKDGVYRFIDYCHVGIEKFSEGQGCLLKGHD